MTPNTARRRKPAAEGAPAPEEAQVATEATATAAPAAKKTAKPKKPAAKKVAKPKKKPAPKKVAKKVAKPKPKPSEIAAANKARLAEAAKGKLDPLAHEINVRVEKAESLEKGADGHRIAAIQRLAEAEKFCKAGSINFKDWCKEHVKWSPETIRKMLPIAKAQDPVLALEQWRNGVKAASATHRAKKKAGTAPRASNKGAQPVALIEHIQAAQPNEQIAIISKAAKDLGMAVVSETDKKKIEQAKDAPAFEDKPVGGDAPAPAVAAPVKASLQSVKDAFDQLKAGDKMKLVNYACEKIGGRLTFANFDAADPGPVEESKPASN